MAFTKKFSIVMATLNAERTIGKALKAIRDQEYPQELVEVLVVDGNSTDSTRAIAGEFKCRIVENPRVEPVSAKLIGLREATGDYLIYCDSDEVMEDRRALQKRALAFMENPSVHIVFAEGYKTPAGAPFVSRFINEFGDPFSMFYYRLSKDCRFFPEDIAATANVVRQTVDYTVYELKGGAEQPIMENAALANATDLTFFRKNYPDLLDKPWGPVHFFYHMQNLTKQFAITRNDAVVHFSSDTWGGFLRKIKWRIKNNIFSTGGGGGDSGFLGREKYSGARANLRKFLFVPYTLLLLPVVLDSLRYVISRRDLRYAGVVPLCLYTIFWIGAYGALKATGYRPPASGYGV